MIIEYTENGQISHIMFDPVPPGVVDVLTEKGSRFLDIPPVSTSEGTTTAKADIFTDYISEGQITPRPVITLPEDMTIAVGETAVIDGLPDPCWLRVDDERIEVTGGSLEIEGEMPATYEIEIDHFPYMPSKVKVTVNEA